MAGAFSKPNIAGNYRLEDLVGKVLHNFRSESLD